MIKRIGNLIRPALVLLAVFLVFGIAVVAYQGIRTLQQLNAVEAERDRWQRPADVIAPLNLKSGSVVVDLGSGAGYFALKLSDVVGPRGRVVAVDLRRLSLLFLRVRAFLQGKRNIQIIVGETDNPHLSTGDVDSVLIANTYHELTDPHAILRHTWRALRPQGRLVIVDRAPPASEDPRESVGHHYTTADTVEADLLKERFSIIDRKDVFIHPPGDEVWWLIVASKS
jgi:ubiquinone/menaquinone biosynthesis C-methylase UbiE